MYNIIQSYNQQKLPLKKFHKASKPLTILWYV